MGHPPNIPLTPQTDERNFPRWQKDAPPGESGSEYPKMLTRFCTKEDREKWLERNRRRDQNTGQDYFEEVAPRLGAPIPVIATPELVDAGLTKAAGEPVIVRDKDHEIEVVALMGLEPAPPKAIIPIAKVPVRDLEAENEELREQLAASRQTQTPAVKKRGRPKKTRVVAAEEVSGEV